MVGLACSCTLPRFSTVGTGGSLPGGSVVGTGGISFQNGSDRGGYRISQSHARTFCHRLCLRVLDGKRCPPGGADGRSLTQISRVINGTTTYKAYYFAESADTDGDGIKDWFEYRMGRSQSGGWGDPDGDGFSNLRKMSSAGSSDHRCGGGWRESARLSTGFVYAIPVWCSPRSGVIPPDLSPSLPIMWK